MRRLLASLFLLGLVSLAGCGGDGDENLAALRFHGDFDFRMDENEGSEHVFTIDYTTTVDRDGNATTDLEGDTSEFELSEDELIALEDALDRLDPEQLAQEYPVGTGNDETSVRITYEDGTAEAGSGLFDDSEDATESGQAVFAVLSILESAEDSGN